jgi:non-ribosomal peptide synthetase component F
MRFSMLNEVLMLFSLTTSLVRRCGNIGVLSYRLLCPCFNSKQIATQTFRGAVVPFQFQAPLSQQLREFAQQEQVSLPALLLTAFFLLLYRYSQQGDLIIGFSRFGRTQPAFEEIVGYFTNFCPIRAKFTSSMSARQALHQVQHHLRASREHQVFPFPLLVERLLSTRDPSISPLFQAAFLYQKTEGLAIANMAGYNGRSVQCGDLPMELYEFDRLISQHDVQLAIEEIQGVLYAGLQYNTDLFESSTIECVNPKIKLVDSVQLSW